MKILAQVLDVNYVIRENKAIIQLYCKTKDKKILVAEDKTFKPYFYVIPSQDKQKLKEKLQKLSISYGEHEIKVTEIEECKKSNISVLKIYSDLPGNIPIIKDEVKHWPEVEAKREFDVPFSRRYLIDKEIEPTNWIQITGKEIHNTYNADLCLEIEKITKAKSGEKITYNTMAFDIEVVKDKIIMISFYSKNFKKVLSIQNFEEKPWYVEIVKSERQLIERFVDIITSRKTEVLLGYNTDRYDFEIIREKADKYGLSLNLGVDYSKMTFQKRGVSHAAKIIGRAHLDLYVFVEHLLSQELKSEVLTLNNVANELLKEKKDDLEWETMEKFWEEGKNLEKIAKYCLRDSELTFKLGEKICPIIYSLSKLISQTPFDVSRLTYGQLVEQLLIKSAYKKNILVPNRPTRDKIMQRRAYTYTGAFVLEPKKGVYKNLAMLDYRSLYPSIIAIHNISPETLNCECCKDAEKILGNHFCKKKKGFIPEVISGLMKERFALKAKLKKTKRGTQEFRDLNTRQLALKYILNASYGYMGYPSARWYCRECAEAIAALGRKYITETIEEARRKGLDVIYCDTDSLLLHAPNVKEKALEFLKEINKKLPDYLELELEDLYDSGIFTYTEKGIGAKKRYALMTHDGELRIKGFEKVRRDWCELAKDVQEKVIRFVLTDKSTDAVKLVQETIQKLKNKEIPMNKLGIYTQLKKTPEKYEITAPHVQAAKRAIERGMDIKPGHTIKYIITEGTGRISDRAEVLKFATNYDSDYYIENQIVPAALRVLKVLGYTEDDFLTKGKQTSLGKFA